MRQRLLARAKSSGRVDDEEEVIEKRLNTCLGSSPETLERRAHHSPMAKLQTLGDYILIRRKYRNTYISFQISIPLG